MASVPEIEEDMQSYVSFIEQVEQNEVTLEKFIYDISVLCDRLNAYVNGNSMLLQGHAVGVIVYLQYLTEILEKIDNDRETST